MVSKSSPAARDRRAGGSFRIWGRPRRRALPGVAAATAAGLLAACSAGGTGGTGGGAGASGQAAASRGGAVSVRTLAGIGTVLVSGSGKTMYAAQQEAHGTIKCTGSCLGFWFPVPAGAGKTAPSGVTGTFGALRRPDNGMTQLTYNGRPLYTFRLDRAPGQAHGDNFSDQFGGTSFTWHAVTTSGAAAGTGPTPASGGSGYSQGGGPGY